jgi:hypothetical protein
MSKAFKESTNIEILKTFILNDLEFKTIVKGNKKINPFKNEKLKNLLEELTKLYKAKLKIVRVEEKQESKKVCLVGGSYFPKNNTIVLRIDKFGCPLISTIIRTYCHELGHHLQNKIFKKYKKEWPLRFSKVLEYERAADEVGWLLYKQHFYDWQILTKCDFKTYNNKKEIIWLINYINHDLEDYDYSI